MQQWIRLFLRRCLNCVFCHKEPENMLEIHLPVFLSWWKSKFWILNWKIELACLFNANLYSGVTSGQILCSLSHMSCWNSFGSLFHMIWGSSLWKAKNILSFCSYLFIEAKNVTFLWNIVKSFSHLEAGFILEVCIEVVQGSVHFLLDF